MKNVFVLLVFGIFSASAFSMDTGPSVECSDSLRAIAMSVEGLRLTEYSVSETPSDWKNSDGMVSVFFVNKTGKPVLQYNFNGQFVGAQCQVEVLQRVSYE